MRRRDRNGPGRLRRLAAADPAVRAVVVEGFTTRLGFGIVTLFLPLYAVQLGMSLAEVGLLAAAKAMVVPVVKPAVGVLVDRFGPRRAYLAAVGLRFAGALLLLVAVTPASLLAVRFLQGAASAARDPASITVLAKQARARLGRTFSVAIGAKDLGNVSAGLVGGAVLALSGGAFTPLWITVVALALVPVLAVWRWVPATPAAAPAAADADGAVTAASGPADAGVAAPATADAPSLLRDPHLRRIALLGLMTGTTAHMAHGLFQVYASEVGGLSAAQIGTIYSASIAALLVLGPTAGWIADRYGTGSLTGARGVANAASSVLYLAFPTLGGIAAGRLVDDAGKAAFRPTWGSLLARATQDAGPRGGRVAASLDTALSVGEALGPLLAGVIWDVWGVAAFFGVRAVLGVATELLVGRRLRLAPERDAEPVGAGAGG